MERVSEWNRVVAPGVEGGVEPMLDLLARPELEQPRCFWCHDRVEPRRAWRCPSCKVLAHPDCGRELFRPVCPTRGCRSQAWAVARRDKGRPTWPRVSWIGPAFAFAAAAVMLAAIRIVTSEPAPEPVQVARVDPRLPDGSILVSRERTSIPLLDVIASDPTWRPRAEAERILTHQLLVDGAAPVEAADAVGEAVAVTPRARDCAILTTHGWRDGAPSTIETWFSRAVPIPVRRVERWTPAHCPGYGAVEERELIGVRVP